MKKDDAAPQPFSRREFLWSAAAVAASLPFANLACTHHHAEAQALSVGGLPVTCNLTLPIACEARDRDLKRTHAKGLDFAYGKFNGWPELKESLMANRIPAGYMLAPLAMDLAARKIPVKVVALGHRSGSVIMVRTDSGYKKFEQLKGKRVAIPSRFAVDYLFLGRMLKDAGMTMKDVVTVEMAPPDMPSALYAKAIDAYCTGEPFGAAAQAAGYAVPLAMTRDKWPDYICCVLTVRDELIAHNRPAVQELVNYVLGAGEWLDKDRANRHKAVQIAAGVKYFHQDPKILDFVMDNPPDRVTYGDLRLIKSQFDELMELSVQAGALDHPIPYETYADESFVKHATAVPIEL